MQKKGLRKNKWCYNAANNSRSPNSNNPRCEKLGLKQWMKEKDSLQERC